MLKPSICISHVGCQLKRQANIAISTQTIMFILQAVQATWESESVGGRAAPHLDDWLGHWVLAPVFSNIDLVRTVSSLGTSD